MVPASPMPDTPLSLHAAMCQMHTRHLWYMLYVTVYSQYYHSVCYMSQFTHSTIKQIFSFSPLKILRSHHPFSSFKMRALVFRFLFYIPSYRVLCLDMRSTEQASLSSFIYDTLHQCGQLRWPEMSAWIYISLFVVI